MPHLTSSPFDVVQLEQLGHDLARVEQDTSLTQPEVDALAARWEAVIRPRPKHYEPFDLVTGDDTLTGVIAPRWLCHLLGLCHRTVHLVLRTPQNWLALQVRGRRVDWPGLLDLSVTGHVRAGLSWQQALQQEAAEELGLDILPTAGMIGATGVWAVGAPYQRSETDSLNPPVHICHLTQVFAATLTAGGLAGLRFSDGEVEGLYLAGFDEVSRMVEETPDRLAPGLTQSWPYYASAISNDH